MDDRFNTIAGWALFAGIVALGGSIVAGEAFHSERPEEMGYPIEGVEEEGGGGEAEQPIAFFLASADPAKGEQVFKKCAACHTATQGGANGIGPNLYGVMGNAVAAHPGFAYSDALKSHGGQWDWESLSAWLANPRSFAPGNKMTFPGLSNPQDRADLMAWLNANDSSPLPIPEAPAPEAAAAEGDQPAEGGEAAEGNEAAPADEAAPANEAAPE